MALLEVFTAVHNVKNMAHCNIIDGGSVVKLYIQGGALFMRYFFEKTTDIQGGVFFRYLGSGPV